MYSLNDSETRYLKGFIIKEICTDRALIQKSPYFQGASSSLPSRKLNHRHRVRDSHSHIVGDSFKEPIHPCHLKSYSHSQRVRDSHSRIVGDSYT